MTGTLTWVNVIDPMDMNHVQYTDDDQDGYRIPRALSSLESRHKTTRSYSNLKTLVRAQVEFR